MIRNYGSGLVQMVFENYLKLMYFDSEKFEKKKKKNMEFCIAWANAQLKAGATAICYFDPLASSSIIAREVYMKKGYQAAKKVISKINGPVAVHLASAPALPIEMD